MDNLRLADALRFAFAGVITFLYWYALDRNQARDFADATGVIGFPILLVTFGSVFYFLYRPFIYDPGIERLQFLIPRLLRLKKKNYRQFLSDEYVRNDGNKVTFDDTNTLWYPMRDKGMQAYYKEYIRLQASGIHMMYMAGILAILFFAVGLVIYRQTITAALFVVVSIMALLAAFTYDRKFEVRECHHLLLNTTQETRDECARKLGFKRKNSHDYQDQAPDV